MFFAVPAEEFIDVEERLRRKERGEIEFLLGKPELVAKGHFDDIDMAMVIHVGSHDQMAKRSYIADSSNGAVVKQIRFWDAPRMPAVRHSSASTRYPRQ